MKQLSILALFAVLLLTACRSAGLAEKGSSTASGSTASSATTHISNTSNAAALSCAKKVASRQLSIAGITASAKVKISGVGGKDVSVNGKLQMKRNAVVRLSLRVLGMEVGLMEFTPSGVLVVDRINKQYVRAAYNEVSFLKQANLDFYSLQSLFWNELFLPGERTLTASDLERFALTADNSGNVLSPKDTPVLTYKFFTDAANSVVNRLEVTGKKASDKGTFSFSYDNFETFSGRPFPTSLLLAIAGTGKKDASLQISLSGLKANADFEASTSVSSKYTQRTPQEILSKLGL